MPDSEHKLSGWLALFSLRKPVTISMMFLSLVVLGMVSANLLPLEHMPKIKLPIYRVSVPYSAATPAEVERNITRPLEEALSTIGDIKSITSNSGTNGAFINLFFHSNVDIDEKGMLVREQIDLTRPQLPDDVRHINVTKEEAGDGGSIFNIRITGEIDFKNAYDVLNQYLVQPIERVPGVARVDLQGIEPLELRIQLDVHRMEAYGVGFSDLQKKLKEANFAIKSGNFMTANQVIRLKIQSRAESLAAYKNLVINQQGVRLSDIAKIEIVNGERNYARHLDRKYSVGLSVYKESTANLVTVADAVLERINELREWPQMKGIQLIFLDNQAEGVRQSLTDVVLAGLIGSGLSLVVLFLFLRNLAMTFVISLSIPVSIIITLGAMYFMGISVNILSLMGLMLAVGMLVDNSVVITESIFTQKVEYKQRGEAAIVAGVQQVMTPVVAGTLTSICVFVPIIFSQENLLALFLTHVAVTIVVALLVSLVLSITVIPMMMERFVRRSTGTLTDHSARVNLFYSMRKKYDSILKFTLAHRWYTFIFIIALIFIGVLAGSQVKSDEGVGERDQREFWLSYHINGSYTLERLKKDVDRIENYLYENQQRFEIDSVYTYYEENGNVSSKITLIDPQKNSKSTKLIKSEIIENMPEIAIGNPSFQWRSRIGNQSLNVYLLGDSHELMREQILPGVLLGLHSVPEIANAQVEHRNKRQEIQVVVDRERSLKSGLNTFQVASSVNVAMRGLNLYDFLSGEGELPVIMRFYQTGQFDIQQLKNLPIKNNRGDFVSLQNVAEINIQYSPQSLFRSNRSGSFRVSLDLIPDSNVSEVKQKIAKKLDVMNFPSGYSWSFKGGGSGFDIEISDLFEPTIIAICLIFIVMAALFESLLLPLSVITSILFSYIGTFIFFAITGTTFTVMAGIGMLILIGVVVNNGIVLVDRINQLRLSGYSRYEAVLQGGKDRLRPILMTVITTVVGLLPLSMSVSQVGGGNGPMYFPMARAIIGGLIFSTVISLLVLPSFYCWLDDLSQWFRARLKQKTVYASDVNT